MAPTNFQLSFRRQGQLYPNRQQNFIDCFAYVGRHQQEYL